MCCSVVNFNSHIADNFDLLCYVITDINAARGFSNHCTEV